MIRTKTISINHSHGMTVLEVVVAVVILSITFTVVMYILSSAEKIRKNSRTLEAAALCASNELELLKASYFSGSRATNFSDTYEAQVGPRKYIITTTVPEKGLSETESTCPYEEVQIVVSNSDDDQKPIITVKVLRAVHADKEPK